MNLTIMLHRLNAASKLSLIRALVPGLLLVAALAIPREAKADCTPLTSSASPVTNTTVTCVGTASNQNTFMGLNIGYGTTAESGDTIQVDPTASVTGDFAGFGLGDGNTVNNSGAVTGGSVGIVTATGSTNTINNLTATSTITGTTVQGLNVTNVVVGNAGTITGVGDAILAIGSVNLASNTGSITATDPNFGVGIRANSVNGSNSGTILGAVAIDTHTGSDIDLSTNSGTIQGNSGSAIDSGGNIVIAANSGSIVGEVSAVGTINVTNTAPGSITATGVETIFTTSGITVTNAGTISGATRAIHGANVDVTNQMGGMIAGGSDAVEGDSTVTLVNDGTISGGTSSGVNADTADITNNTTGIIEATGDGAVAIGPTSLFLNNSGIVRETGNQSFAIDVDSLQTGSTNSGTIVADSIGINSNVDLNITNSGTIEATGIFGFVTSGIQSVAAAIVNTSSGVISGETRGISASDLSLTNSGTITATGAFGFQVAGIIVNTGDIVNTSTGIISATGTNANNDAINIQGDGVTVDNAGLISSTGRSAVRVGSDASISNESGGTITGVTGIVFRDPTAMNVPVINGNVFNAGTITGTGGTAINFAFTPGSGPMTLTLGPGSVINGTVLGTGGDTLQLGGTGSDTFDVDNIGSTLQYQGFVTFNKVDASTWTLTGTGAQNWSIVGGTLIGDTNSLGAATYPVGAGATLEFKQDFDSTYSGVVSGAGSLAKDGAGTLILTNDNSYTGGTTINGGTLQIGDGGTTGSIVGDVVDNGTLEVNQSSDGTYAGVISGNGTLVKAGTGTLTLTGVSTYGSGTFILPGGGTLALAGAGSIANSSDLSDNGTFDISAAAGGVSIQSLEGKGSVVLGANTLTLTAAAGFFGGIISGTGGLTLIGSSQETLTGTYSYSGQTTVAAPNLLAPVNKASLIGTLVLAGSNNTLTGDIVDDGVLVAQATSLTLSGNISGSGSLSVKGGTTTLDGNNNYAGGTTVAGSTLSISSDGNLGTGALSLLGGSTLQLTASFTLSHAISVAGDPTFDVAGSNVVVISTPITDGAVPGDVVKTGSGTLQLTADNTYTGGTTISQGVLLLGNAGTMGSIVGDVVDNSSLAFLRSDTVTFAGSISGTGNIDKLGSATLILTGTNTNTGGVLIASGTLQVGNGSTSGSIAGNVSDNGALAFDRSDTLTVTGLIFGTGSLSQIGTGKTILTAFDTYTGGTTISAGTLQIGNGGTSGFLIGDVVDNGTLAFDRSDSFNFSGFVSGTGSVSQIGTGTTVLTGTNTYTGGTTISAGTLQLGGGSTTGSIVGNVVDNGTLAFDRSDTVMFNGVISGGGGVVQDGTGTTILTGANTFGGGTFVNGGTLQLGTLDSLGSVVGPITVSASTLLSVVNSDFSQVTTLAIDDASAVFQGIASAAAAKINVTNSGNLTFFANATAAQAQISLDHSVASFRNASSAGSAQFTISNIGSVIFNETATAANGKFSVGGGAAVVFFGSSTGGSAQISAAQNGSVIEFEQMSTAGNAMLSLSQQAMLTFVGQASAGHAQIALASGTNLLLFDTSSGGLATIITAAGSQVNIAGLTNGGTTIGSINGAGDVILGANALTLGGDDSNSDIGGVISGGGGLIKLGTGTTTLTGASTYTGGTTISAGTVQIGNGGTSGAITGNVVDNGALAFDRSDNVTFAGVISGGGSVSQIGSGRTILSSDNTYTGGTTISGGTLQVGNGGTSGSIVGNVANNGTLAFDRTDAVTFDGVISGGGGVNQIGAGTTVLTGTSPYTGATAVVAGTLDLNGSIANSVVTVNGGATLKGNGTTGSVTLASGSTIAPGNSIGTLHVAGNISFAAGSIFQVEANPAGMADLIDATGRATINSGATVQVIAAPGTYQFGTTYKIVSAAGGVSGTFGGLSLNTPIVTGQLVYGADFVDLVLSPADIDLRPFEHTPNEIATGTAVKAGGPLSSIFGQFLALQPDLAFITGTLDELSGEIHPSLATAELGDTQVVRQSVLNRLRQSTAGDATGLLAPSQAQSRTIVADLTMWTQVFAETGSVDSDGNAAEIRQNQSGILAGIDAALAKNLTLGIGGGYTHTRLNQRTSSARGGDGYIIASAGWSDGPLALRAGGSYAWGTRDVIRHVSFPGFAETLTSKPDEHASQIFGEAGYAGRLSELAFEPFAGLSWSDAAIGAFSETGGTAALAGRGGDSALAYSSLGIRLATSVYGGESFELTPQASFAWQHAFGGLRPQQFVTFEDTRQTFLVLGTTIDADMANVDVGLDAKIGDSAKLAVGYEGLLSSRVRLNTLHAGLSWTF